MFNHWMDDTMNDVMVAQKAQKEKLVANQNKIKKKIKIDEIREIDSE